MLEKEVFYMSADIGLIGLATMGKNLVLNMLDHNVTVCVYNRTISKVDDLKKETNNKNLIAAHSMKEFFKNLKSPCVIMLMIKAGQPVDDFIKQILPFLSENDVVIDGGNSHFLDTERRANELEKKKIHFKKYNSEKL